MVTASDRHDPLLDSRPVPSLRRARLNLCSIATACAALGLAGCEDDAPSRMEPSAGGDARVGRLVAQSHGCAACHTIPGISGPHGRAGPSLAGFARRVYIAGIVPNQPALLTRWLLDPPALAPRTAMPDVGLTPEEATDLAAFLYTLE